MAQLKRKSLNQTINKKLISVITTTSVVSNSTINNSADFDDPYRIFILIMYRQPKVKLYISEVKTIGLKIHKIEEIAVERDTTHK